MSKQDHTPGPWVAIPETLHPTGFHVAGRSPKVQDASGNTIASVTRNGARQGRDVEAENRARLIAAAPELVEALRELVDHIGECERIHDEIDVCGRCGWSHAVLNRARALLAKVEG